MDGVPRDRHRITIVRQPTRNHCDQSWLFRRGEFEGELRPMMLIGPDHQGPGIPLRIKADLYLGVEDVVIGRHKEEHGRGIVHCAVKRINEPVRLLAGTDRQFVAMFDLPANWRVLPLEITRHNIDSRLLSERRGPKYENQNQACSWLKTTHVEPPRPPIWRMSQDSSQISRSKSCPMRGQLSTELSRFAGVSEAEAEGEPAGEIWMVGARGSRGAGFRQQAQTPAEQLNLILRPPVQ